MELTENDILRLEIALVKAFESFSTDANALVEFCNYGDTFPADSLKYMGQFGDTQFTDRIRGDYQEYQVVQADGKLWLVWGDDPEVDGNVWVLPIWQYL
jgi:hypothetical protein